MHRLRITLAFLTVVTLAPWAVVADVDENCVHGGCHAGMGEAEVVHDPMDDCSNCHEPIEGVDHSDLDKLKAGAEQGFNLTADYPDLCLDCHDDFMEEGENVEKHSPVEDGECGECHDPHQSNNIARLRKPVVDTCLECHDDMEDQVRKSRSTHDALDEDEGCVVCHNPHGNANEYFFKVTPVAQLCNQCHDDLIDEIQSVPSEYRHGPIRQGQCQKCHDPHGSRWEPLLQKPYTPLKYAPFRRKNYALCLSCHKDLDLRKPDPRRKPIEHGFANGRQNLHYVHVNRRKGRTCRFCHAPHYSPNRHLLNDKVQFGRWQFSLRWAFKDGKGQCSPACHSTKSYDKATPPKIIEAAQ